MLEIQNVAKFYSYFHGCIVYISLTYITIYHLLFQRQFRLISDGVEHHVAKKGKRMSIKVNFLTVMAFHTKWRKQNLDCFSVTMRAKQFCVLTTTEYKAKIWS